jgi:YHS domain-containing protein
LLVARRLQELVHSGVNHDGGSKRRRANWILARNGLPPVKRGVSEPVFRAILYLLLSFVVISVIRSVVGVIGKLFGEMVSPSSGPSGTSGRSASSPGSPTVESLHKDPVCGTFVAPSTAWQKAVGGKTYYFCSIDCREKFKG